MASITIRNLDKALKQRLRIEAATHGHSMEEEARRILRRALEPPNAPDGLGERIRARFAGVQDFELELPNRDEPPRDVDLGS